MWDASEIPIGRLRRLECSRRVPGWDPVAVQHQVSQEVAAIDGKVMSQDAVLAI